MTPVSLPDGDIVSNPFDAPGISVIANGRVQDEWGSCNTDALENAGYGWRLDLEVTAGTPYPFYEEIYFEPGQSGSPDFILVGDGNDPIVFEATLLTEVPSP